MAKEALAATAFMTAQARWGQLQTLRESARARRLFTLAAAVVGVCLSARWIASKLLVSLLYHPFRYEEEPTLKYRLEEFCRRLRPLAYHLVEVDCSPPSARWTWRRRQPMQRRAFLLAPECAPPTVFWAVFGGNGMVAVDWLPFCRQLLDNLPAGPGVPKPAFLLVDYPGYGANDGQPSPRSVLEGQLAAIQATVDLLGGVPSELNLLGHSLGAAAASQLAARFREEAVTKSLAARGLRPGRLVLSAPFVNIEAMTKVLCRNMLRMSGPPEWLIRLLVSHHWKNTAWVPQAAAHGWKLHIIHGARDTLVPLWMGKALRDSVLQMGQPCEFTEIPAAGHNDLLSFVSEYAYHMELPVKWNSAL